MLPGAVRATVRAFGDPVEGIHQADGPPPCRTADCAGLIELGLLALATTASVEQAAAVPSATLVMPKDVAVATTAVGVLTMVAGSINVQCASVPDVTSVQVPGSVNVAAGLSAHCA